MTNKPTHTPGPWTLKTIMHGTRKISGPLFHVMTLERDVCEADARLIAAAPELLEALQEADLMLAEIAGGKTYTLKEWADKTINRRAAITKATGGAQ